MDQNNPNSGYGNTNSGTTGGTTGSTSGGYGTGSSGGGYTGSNSGANTSAFGVTSGSDLGSAGGAGTNTGVGGSTGTCPHCGQSLKGGAGLEQFLGRLGITDDMINNLKTQFANVDIDEYLNTARDYLKDSSGKAQTYAKENPGKVAAGVAALALGAGLIYAAVNRDKA
jgi:hypothetical protein